ncbi:3'-5' exoribonuclease YhaM family protein [Dethiobacter alkaliphilus]|uniref:Metal dependent phosphohydrolase n=1 Tax=Dethiobacter alkaliphilus AHT 1 TaxID=555088 RepID=C0GF25_DETAL|nr:HD domain-containing protein [Dethiobacter alkaliphilus]EEG78207.1 metal dependent phosphohydrolase [Dethiobacter alkaliphilus AHT 1]
MDKQFISDLKTGDTVHSEFVATEKTLIAFNQPNRAGEQFLRMQLADRSGTIRAVAWDKGPELAGRFEIGDVLRVRGEVGHYRGPQLVVSGLEPVPPEEVQRQFFQRVAPREREDMLGELRHILTEITQPHLAELMKSFFEDKEFFRLYSEAPAARSVHHNYVGGLLEHSLEVAALCYRFARSYHELDQSLLLCGALMHDMGKIEEYDTKSLTFEMTTRGKLIGHIVIGKEMLDERVRQIPGFPAELQMELSHLILSHHGQKEWGSPEVPRTFAAFALHHADLVSARLNQFAQVAGKGSKPDGWTDYDRLLERDVYLGLAE